MPEQERMATIASFTSPIEFQMGGCRYRIIQDQFRASRNMPSWWVERMQDGLVSKRYYSEPPGAFNAVYWQSAEFF